MSAIDTHGGNCEMLSAEVMERVCPIRVVRTELVANSGGEGRYRGGLAIRRDYELLCDDVTVNAYVQQTADQTRPWATDGGGKGAAARIALHPDTPEEQELPCKAMGLRLKAGSVVRLQSSGGGGLGDAAARDAELVESDRRLGYTSA
jgi:N-methylhydantoinase B